jgi:hypothetical protein
MASRVVVPVPASRLHLGQFVRSARPTCRAASIAVCHRSTPAWAPPHPLPPASRAPTVLPSAHSGSESCRGRRRRETKWIWRRAGASAAIGDEAAARARASWRRIRSSAAGSRGAARGGGVVVMACSEWDAARLGGRLASFLVGVAMGCQTAWFAFHCAFAWVIVAARLAGCGWDGLVNRNTLLIPFCYFRPSRAVKDIA